jgi:hypothetical protein
MFAIMGEAGDVGDAADGEEAGRVGDAGEAEDGGRGRGWRQMVRKWGVEDVGEAGHVGESASPLWYLLM